MHKPVASISWLVIPPTFTIDGALPAGRHVADVDEVRTRFVEPFPVSSTRQSLYDAWRIRRQTLFAIVQVEMEWVNGSFVTAKHAPNDIDVTTFISAENLAALTVGQLQEVWELTAGPTPQQVGCHSFLVVVFRENHPLRDAYLRNRGYWDDWWSRRRTGPEKGYIDVRGQA